MVEFALTFLEAQVEIYLGDAVKLRQPPFGKRPNISLPLTRPKYAPKMNRSPSELPVNPLHIAFVISSLHGGGAERVILALARELIERGHRVDLVLFNMRIHYPEWVPGKARLFVVNDHPDEETRNHLAYGELCKRIIPVGPCNSRWYDRIRLAKTLKWNPLTLPTGDKYQKTRRMVEYIRREQPDVILPNLISATASTLLARHFIDSPPVVPIIHSLMKRRRAHKPIRYSPLLQDAARVVAVSNGVGDSVRRETGVGPDKLVTIYNPVVPPELDHLKSRASGHPWLADNGPPVVLACGRLTEVKDFPVLIKAFAKLAEQRPCRLIILGEGRQRKPLEDLAAALGLREKVSLPGWTDNPYAFMSRAALFVLSSRSEGLPTVLIEALACGCPCVSTNCPTGPTEILQGGEIGPLVKVGDHVALADAMLRTLATPPDKQKLLHRAGFFSTEKLIDMYEELIAKIVG